MSPAGCRRPSPPVRARVGSPDRRLADPPIGPWGLRVARARVEMEAIETIIHLRREQPRRLRTMVPPRV